MKIVLIGPAYPLRGGIANFVAQTAFHLEKNGHAVSIVNFSRQYPDFLFPGKTQLDVSRPAFPFSSKRIIDSIRPGTWVKAANYIQVLAPDLVLYNHWMPFFAPAYGTLAALLRTRKAPAQICVCHNVTPHERRPGDRILNRFFLRQMNAHIVLSKAVESDLQSLIPGAKIVKVLHPISESFGGAVPKKEARNRLKLPADAPVLLFFGYVRRYKGLDILLRALPRVLEKTPDARLLVVGEFYESKEEYDRLIETLGIENSVTVVDDFVPNEQVGFYFSAADVVVMPYRSATQSGIIPIAYEFARPVITTNVGGLSDFVDDEKTGILTEPENPEAVAAAILKFIAIQDQIPFEQNIRHFQENFSWSTLIESIEKLAENKWRSASRSS
ncbi:D-inositol 3-phosphate glycosyltransferase [bacterium BMS3Abin05]|nr:D-inositol 3-phosphate glycosyltransferase [bacterium BMS3Abin05]GBE27472.1 D-inositol 3-phosphate glycosyltransferase [bacterium BMS3Bbin03]